MAAFAGLASVQAAVTDLAVTPLITSSPQEVKPNLMFILDDSGSMQWTYMPDEARYFDTVGGNDLLPGIGAMYGYRSYQCNGVYYNPGINYVPPVTATGTSYPNASFTAAWLNGFDTAAGVVDLSNNFRAFTTSDNWNSYFPGPANDTAQAAYYYTYSGTETTEALRKYADPNSTFYKECASAIGAAPGSTKFARVNVGANTGPGGTDERTNFANWYSYYRTRILTMKTAAGQSFKSIGSEFRVGYMTLNNAAGNSFLGLNTFDTTQKTTWYSKLYGAVADGGTPLRAALSDVGRMYAGTLTTLYGSTVADPVQYSCQKNFSLLSTDGYWNSGGGVRVDGSTAIGDQDSSEPRPFTDGGTTANVYQSTLTVGGGTNTTISGIAVNGFQILSSAAVSGTAGSAASTLATQIAVRINNCSSALNGNCTVAGYTAVASGSSVTIRAPSALGVVTYTPTVNRTAGTRTVAASAFSGTTVSSGGTPDSLADVAMYYYKTDLRDGMENNVLASNDDPAIWQHMTTFTLGLGARGSMVYSATYPSDTAGDYFAVKTGQTASSTVCNWQTAGSACNWPAPSADGPTAIDDLWHAAVNGRGRYFSAKDPATLSDGLSGALQAIASLTSASATSATSNPNVTNGDNFRFLSTFTSAEWTGQLERYNIDLTSGEESGGAVWQAKELLNAKTSRTIYTYSTASGNRLKPFDWANLSAAEQAYFSLPWISSTSTGATPLTQFCAAGTACLPAATQGAAAGAPLVNFLRGDRTQEGTTTDLTKYFRLRAAVLGDLVTSRATYVKAPRMLYTDDGYAAFKTAQASRNATVYVGANDGMLHAFNADNGDERWAYVPSLVLPNLFKLADKRYAVNHQYYVDGSPIEADVKFSDNSWHSIIVGGLNRGGRGYYALDVTDPGNPRALWEFSHTNMGFSYGRPEIAKLKNGNWVVLLTSGYNNINPGDGNGHLYVLDAATGALLNTIDTGAVGTAATPSGLAQIRAWVDNGAYDNTALRVYGGDLLGNVWRFDINGDVGAAGTDAQRLTTLTGPGGVVQPITSKPELGRISNKPVVFIGTGRSLGVSDIYDANVQSIYAIKDRLDTTTLGSPRNLGAQFVRQIFSNSTCTSAQAFCSAGESVRTSTSNAVNFNINDGWYVDLPARLERVDTDPQLAFGVLGIASNSLSPTACELGGTSFVNLIDYRTGGALSNATGMVSLGRESLSTGVSYAIVVGGDGTGKLIWTQSKSDGTSESGEVKPPTLPPTIGRTSWRELPTE